MRIITSSSREFAPEAVLDFLVSHQQSPATACGYLNDDPAEIRRDLEALDQPWESTVRVALDDQGKIIGAALVEWDEETDRAEIYGPWADDAEVAAALLTELTPQIPVNRLVLYAPTGNETIEKLAVRQGYQAGDPSYAMSLPLESVKSLAAQAGTNSRITIRAATPNDAAAVAAIHNAAFPNSYATSENLVTPNSEYDTLVAEIANKVVGYLAHQKGEYLDFVAVLPEFQRLGVARALVSEMLVTAPTSQVSLTADGDGSLTFWKRLGFRPDNALRDYAKVRAAGRQVVLFIAASLDGFIADSNNNLDWLFKAEGDGDNGFSKFYATVDTVLLGRKTYDWIRQQEGDKPPYADKEVFVFSRTKHDDATFVSADQNELGQLIQNLKSKNGQDIWLVGGGELISQFLNAKLLDQIRVSIAPVILGSGIPLFPNAASPTELILTGTHQNGQFLELCYRVKK